jgi:hypothetical protein
VLDHHRESRVVGRLLSRHWALDGLAAARTESALEICALDDSLKTMTRRSTFGSSGPQRRGDR